MVYVTLKNSSKDKSSEEEFKNVFVFQVGKTIIYAIGHNNEEFISKGSKAAWSWENFAIGKTFRKYVLLIHSQRWLCQSLNY